MLLSHLPLWRQPPNRGPKDCQGQLLVNDVAGEVRFGAGPVPYVSDFAC